MSRSEVFEVVAPAFRFSGPTREEVLLEARLHGARQEVLGLLEELPARRFDDVRDVWQELPDLVTR